MTLKISDNVFFRNTDYKKILILLVPIIDLFL